MNGTRCSLCHEDMTTISNLKSHYMKKHNKSQITNELVRSSKNGSPHVLNKSTKNKQKQRAVEVKPELETHILNDKVHHTFIIEGDSNKDNLIELSIDSKPVCSMPLMRTSPEGSEVGEENGGSTTPRSRKSKRSKKGKKLFHIDICNILQESPKSLSEFTGEFYECHCKDTYSSSSQTNKASSDTESCSDIVGPNFYCSFCGNGYNNVLKLKEHEAKSHLHTCKMCNQSFNFQDYKLHIEQHLVRIFVCHWCNMEFINKEMLIAHLGCHFEQQTFENVLNMEQDYNVPSNYSQVNDDYYAHLNNIKVFLTYPYDHYYSRMLLQSRTCDYCMERFQASDYERHLKFAHFVQ